MQAKRIRIVISLVVVFGFTLSSSTSVFGGPPPQHATSQDQQFQAMKNNFDTGRQLLLKRGVPFDPDELLHEGWTSKLKATLDGIPEMHETRYETSPLHDVYMADTLYLPEKVQLSGHTLILANYVVFEGKNPVIRGNFDISFFPAKPVTVLDATLSEILRQRPTLLNVKYGGKPSLPPFLLVKDLVKVTPHVITLDTSGPEPQALRPAPPKSATLRTASWIGPPPTLFPVQTCSTGCNTSGDTGTTGTSGTPGGSGPNGLPGGVGPDGTCPSSPNGSDGANGGVGQNGGNGGNGGQGGTGGNAGGINASVTDGDVNQYSFIANGGTGGVGGEGGKGGSGGNAGHGGNGGNSVACGCVLGKGGNGADGGAAGSGGRGADGGPGGTGGNGGTIVVSLPFNSPGATTSSSGGNGGLGGSGGVGGIGGGGGQPGAPGTGATACGSKANDGISLLSGSDGEVGSSGNAGPNGSAGQAGPAPSITFRPAPSGGGGGDVPDPCLNSSSIPLSSGPSGDYNSPDCSPILIDTQGDGFHLTSAQAGVVFDMAGNGHPVQIAWTDSHFQNAFLTLPGADGLVHNGKELFGNFTPQPQSPHPNGFIALSQFDKPENGGNGDGMIDERDAVYARLRLWIDANHDGVCQPEELHRLSELGIYSLALSYTESRRTDPFGNQFRYRAQVNPGDRRDPRDQTPSGDPGRWTYDVFFVTK
jgi:hypothetical protein